MSKKQATNNCDVRKATWDGIPIDSWDSSKWRDWKPKATGTDYWANMEREYLRIKFAVTQANNELEIDKVRVKLRLTSPNAIGLRGSFPCKQGDIGKNGSSKKQYTISLGLPASDGGLKIAKARARELDLLLTTKQFQWTSELLGKQSQKIESDTIEQPQQTIAELITEYEVEFWKTHTVNRKSIRNWQNHYHGYLKRLPQDVCLSHKALIQALDTTEPCSQSRNYMVWQLTRFCDFCNFDATKLINSYTTRRERVRKRILPTDEEIIQNIEKISQPLHCYRKRYITEDQWLWAYGMLATYGLRPHELFAIDLEHYTNSSNTLYLLNLDPTITDGTKTGERNCLIPPLYPEWVELFDLTRVRPLPKKSHIRHAADHVSRRFRNVGMSFHPYDLRHAYAIRGHKLRIPIKTMADCMGHTVREHTETYQKWMDKDINLEIYKEIVIEKQATNKEILQARIAELESELTRIKSENELLRMKLTRFTLENLLD